MTRLTPLERDVLNLALAGSPQAQQFQRQVENVQVVGREHSGVGLFVHLIVAPECVDEKLKKIDLEVGDVIADLPGLRHGLGFVVFIRSGALDLLEGYTFGDEKWPTDLDGYRLRREDSSAC